MAKKSEGWKHKVERWDTPLYKRVLGGASSGLKGTMKSALYFIYPTTYRFFFPKIIPGDVVSEIFVKAYRWSFYTTLVIAFPYYFLLHDNEYVQKALWKIFRIVTFVSGEKEEYESKFNEYHAGDINGLFFVISVACAWIFFSRNIKRIPPDVYDLGWGCIVRQLGIFLFIVGGFFFVEISRVFEEHPEVTVLNLMLLVVFCYVYAFLAVQSVRVMLDLSVFVGWRVTNGSPWNRQVLPKHLIKYHKRRKK